MELSQRPNIRDLLDESFEKLVRKLRFGLESSDEVEQLIEAGQQWPGDREAILETLVMQDYPNSLERLRNPFDLPEPAELNVDDEIVLGNLRAGDLVFEETYSVSRAACLEHMLMVGAAGTGKTTLMMKIVKQLSERGTRVLILDPEGEYGVLAEHLPPGDCLVVDAQDLRINLLEGPPGASDVEWAARLGDLVREHWYLRDVSAPMLRAVLAQLLSDGDD